MSDFKSKLPDLQELSSMTNKLFKGLKKSINEIIHDYKEKRAIDESTVAATETVKTEEPQKETVTPAENTAKINSEPDNK